MTREEAREILESGGSIKAHLLTFYAYMVSCEDGCCNDGFSGIEEALDSLEMFMGFNEDDKQ